MPMTESQYDEFAERLKDIAMEVAELGSCMTCAINFTGDDGKETTGETSAYADDAPVTIKLAIMGMRSKGSLDHMVLSILKNHPELAKGSVVMTTLFEEAREQAKRK